MVYPYIAINNFTTKNTIVAAARIIINKNNIYWKLLLQRGFF